MKSRIWLGLLLALFTGHAWGATNSGQSVVFIPGVQNGTCSTWPTCPAVPNDATHLFYFAPGTGVTFTLGGSLPAYASTPTFNLGTLNGAALDATIQSVLATLQAPLTFNLPTGASTSALQSTGNGYLLTLSTFTTSASTSALQSTGNGFLSTLATASASQATGAKQDTGNTSLASILTKLNSSVAVTGTFWQATQPVSASSLPLPANAAQEGGGNLAAAAGSTATTATNTGAISTGTGTPADAAYSGSGSTTVIGGLKGLYSKGGQNASVDGSTTQATGGTAQALFSGATPSHGWKVSIPVTFASISTFACFVSDGTTTPSATTAGSQMVYAGGQYSTEPGQKPFGPVYVNCPTTGQAISAQMW